MTDTKQIPKWDALGYQPVRGLVNTHIARYLRHQRKNMRRFFAERGMVDWFLRLEEIRKDPRRDFMQKNRSFQRILNEYTASSVPSVADGMAPKAGDTGAPGSGVPAAGLDVRAAGPALAVSGADLSDHDGGGVPEVARDDGAQPVIEE